MYVRPLSLPKSVELTEVEKVKLGRNDLRRNKHSSLFSWYIIGNHSSLFSREEKCFLPMTAWTRNI
jgi:hypothetical protein